MTGKDDMLIACEQVEWQFKCPRCWGDLMPTNDADVRYCSACHRGVYVCKTVEEVNHYARLGECIAWVAPPESRQEQGERHYVIGEARPVYNSGPKSLEWGDE